MIIINKKTLRNLREHCTILETFLQIYNSPKIKILLKKSMITNIKDKNCPQSHCLNEALSTFIY